jgi:hypothetical protein
MVVNVASPCWIQVSAGASRKGGTGASARIRSHAGCRQHGNRRLPAWCIDWCCGFDELDEQWASEIALK